MLVQQRLDLHQSPVHCAALLKLQEAPLQQRGRVNHPVQTPPRTLPAVLEIYSIDCVPHRVEEQHLVLLLHLVTALQQVLMAVVQVEHSLQIRKHLLGGQLVATRVAVAHV